MDVDSSHSGMVCCNNKNVSIEKGRCRMCRLWIILEGVKCVCQVSVMFIALFCTPGGLGQVVAVLLVLSILAFVGGRWCHRRGDRKIREARKNEWDKMIAEHEEIRKVGRSKDATLLLPPNACSPKW